jgi:hypothetical protein
MRKRKKIEGPTPEWYTFAGTQKLHAFKPQVLLILILNILNTASSDAEIKKVFDSSQRVSYANFGHVNTVYD